MKKFNPVYLPYAAAMVNALLFGMAGYRYFNLGAWGAIIGLGVGSVVSFSVATTSSRISEVAQKRQGLARLAMFGMMCLSPATIVLSLFIPSSVFTAIAWAMDTDVAIVLTGAIAGKGLIAQETTPQVASNDKNVAGKGKKVAGNKKKVAGKGKAIAPEPLTNESFVAYIALHPKDSHSAIARHFQVSRQAIDKRFDKMPIDVTQEYKQ